MKHRILIIDDEPSICITLAMALSKKYAAEYTLTAKDGLSLLKAKDFSLVLLDLKIGNDDGLAVLKEIKEYNPNIAVIMITAYGSIDSTIEAMRAGAYTYLTKPLRVDELMIHVEQALHVLSLEERISHLTGEAEGWYNYYGIIGNSDGMKKVFSLVEKVRDSTVGVLITGESGSGKELVARAIHYSGNRKNANFVAVNCAAIPENLLEDEMFGHVKGAYTGALGNKRGRFEQADGGTLFLDEIGDMPLSMQGKLLRVLQEKRFSPVGSEETIESDVRILAATNRNLEEMVENGTFREDLYYRIKVMEIRVPPLRERQEDIPKLCEFFAQKFAREQNKTVPHFSEEAMAILMGSSFPGNVRQLANIIEYAVIVCEDNQITAREIPDEVRGKALLREARVSEKGKLLDISGKTMKEIEKCVILSRLEENRGHQQKTAQSLGISERNLRNKLTEYRQEKRQ